MQVASLLIYAGSISAGGARWLSVGLRSERSGVRNLPPPCCVLEQDTLFPESTGKLPRKRWLRPDMTEKLLTGTLSLNTNKQKHLCCKVKSEVISWHASAWDGP